MEQIGFLSYAVVAIDGSPDDWELKRVQSFISDKVKAIAGTEPEEDTADWLITLVAFKEAARTSAKPSVLVRDFERFSDSAAFRHIGPKLRSEGFEVLKYSAAALKGTGRAESALLQRLQNRF
jgi:hypothetical protein